MRIVSREKMERIGCNPFILEQRTTGVAVDALQGVDFLEGIRGKNLRDITHGDREAHLPKIKKKAKHELNNRIFFLNYSCP